MTWKKLSAGISEPLGVLYFSRQTNGENFSLALSLAAASILEANGSGSNYS